MILLSFFLTFLMPQDISGETVNLTVRISGVETTEGQLLIAVYRPEDPFLEEHIFKGKKAAPDQGNVSATLSLPKGVYAVAVHHDLNSNDKMDLNFIGIPREPFGVSNNAIGFGKPSFEDASFNLAEHRQIHIKLESF